MSALSRVVVAYGCLMLLACSSGKVAVGIDHGADVDAGSGGAEGGAAEPSATTLLAALGTCAEISNGELAPESGRSADVRVCGLTSAVFWKSEFAVDCDGKTTSTCNASQDKQFSPSTVGKDSAGNSLDAAAVPYVEVPVPSSTFNYHDAGLSMGSVAAVIYKDRLAYGAIGHEQEAGTIGAGSYALAERLGIDPNPVTGGLQSESVTYVAFTGATNQVSALEDESQAIALGKIAAAALIASAH